MTLVERVNTDLLFRFAEYIREIRLTGLLNEIL